MLNLFLMAGLAKAVAAQTAETPGAAGASARAESKAARLQRQNRVLDANLAKTLLICETLWEFIKEHHNLTDEELRKKIYEVDMRDGVIDGKNQRKAVKCHDCGHTVSARHPACLYCGNVIDSSVFTL